MPNRGVFPDRGRLTGECLACFFLFVFDQVSLSPPPLILGELQLTQKYWNVLKMRVNARQEFVIGGYTVGGTTFDALVFGYYDADKLIYAARTRNGFTSTSRPEV